MKEKEVEQASECMKNRGACLPAVEDRRKQLELSEEGSQEKMR